MKLWEVMRLLGENPTDVYEATLKGGWTVRMTVKKGFGGYYNFEVFNDKRLIDQSLGGGGFNGNVAVDLDWQLVRQPVTWQEAIQEFAKGKKLVVNFNNQEWTLGALVELPQYLDRAITNGKWYVE